MAHEVFQVMSHRGDGLAGSYGLVSPPTSIIGAYIGRFVTRKRTLLVPKFLAIPNGLPGSLVTVPHGLNVPLVLNRPFHVEFVELSFTTRIASYIKPICFGRAYQ